MTFRKTFSPFHALLIGCLALVACAAMPELVAKSAIVPAGTDLSGYWQLRVESGAKAAPPGGAEPGIRIPPQVSRRNPERRPNSRSSGTAARVFFEKGESLKITQTGSGLFISFDRAVVEEYTFGENRTVEVGPIEAQRVSGWEGTSYVVETLDRDGALLTEAWRLADNGAVLVRDVSLVQGDKQKWFLRERFDRS